MTSFLLTIFTFKYYTVYELMNKLNMTIILYMYTYRLLSHVFDPHLDKGTPRESIVYTCTCTCPNHFLYVHVYVTKSCV